MQKKPGVGSLLAFAEYQARGQRLLLALEWQITFSIEAQMELLIQLSSLLPEEMSHKSVTFKCGQFPSLAFIQLEIITGAQFWQQVADYKADP